MHTKVLNLVQRNGLVLGGALVRGLVVLGVCPAVCMQACSRKCYLNCLMLSARGSGRGSGVRVWAVSVSACGRVRGPHKRGTAFRGASTVHNNGALLHGPLRTLVEHTHYTHAYHLIPSPHLPFSAPPPPGGLCPHHVRFPSSRGPLALT